MIKTLSQNLFTLCFIFLGFLTNNLVANTFPINLKFRILAKEQGLSSSKVFAVFQDSKGYIWLGTSFGLNLYDGYKISTFYFNAIDSTTISNNVIQCISEDKDHNIWIGTIAGLNKFDRKNNSFKRYSYDANKKEGISSNVILDVLCDYKGNLWVATISGGLDVLMYGTKNFKRYNFPPHLAKANLNYISCLYESKDKSIWIGTDEAGLLKMTKNGRFFSYKKGVNGITPSNGITSIKEDRFGNLWIGTKDAGVSCYNSKNKTVQFFNKDNALLFGNVIKGICIDFKDNLWVGVENGGLNIFDYVHKKFLHYKGNSDDPNSFIQKTAGALLEDNQHNLWVGSHGGGVFIYSPDRYKFNLKTEYQGQDLVDREINSFVEDNDGNLWIGSDGGGVSLWDRQKNRIKVFRHDANNPNSLSSDAVLSIVKDKQGVIWVGTWNGGLNRYNPISKSFTHFIHNPSGVGSISSNDIYCLFVDSRNTLWVATYNGGINYYNKNTGKFYRFRSKNKVLSNSFISINEDKLGNLWFGSNEAMLYRYFVKEGVVATYFYPNLNKSRSIYGNVEAIFNDSKGRLWIGKNNLFMFDFKTKKFKRPKYNVKFPNTNIQGILEDNAQNLWISTTNGLVKYNPETGYVKRFTVTDGLQSLEFNRNSIYKTSNSELLFGSNKGLNVFNPDSIKSAKFNVPIYLTDFQIFNKSVPINTFPTLQTNISQAKEVIIEYQQSLFSFEYAALNYVTPENTQYAYMLEGFDKGWNYVGTQRKATYTNLNPGKYVFKVKASYNGSDWDNKPTTINVIIVPPFWMTWWFETLMAMMLVLLVFILLYQRRKIELRKLEEQKKEEIQTAQLQFFTNISHELRTPLSLILGPLEKVMKVDQNSPFIKSYNTMYSNALRLMRLISEIIDFRKIESGNLSLNINEESLEMLISEIASDFTEKAKELNLKFVTVLPKSEEVLFDKQVIEKIVINLLNNAFKYTASGGNVTIEILSSLKAFKPSFENEVVLKNNYKAHKSVYIRVADTGIGISKSSINHLFERYFRITQDHLGSGLGLAFVKSLTFLHKGEIYVYSEKQKGTEIIIGIPIAKEDYLLSEIGKSDRDEGLIQLESVRYKDILQATSTLKAQNTPSNSINQMLQSILIVDDNVELRAFLKECLEGTYYVIEANNGVEGLAIAKEKMPDLILSDVMMPEMDGIELCKRLKEDIETSHIPIIMLTAKDALQTRISGVGFGADHYFNKPVNIDILTLSIKNLFDQRRKLKEKYLNDYTVKAKELAFSAKDKEFIEKLLDLIEAEIENSEFSVEKLSKEIGMSQASLLRKIKEITGQTINEFVRSVRLKRAVYIMTHEDITVTEIMYRVGIQSQSYFSTTFKKEFGKTPSQFLQELELKAKNKF